MIGLLDDLLPPLVLDVVDAELDLVKLSGRWEDAFEPLDLDGVGVLQAGLLLHDGELLDLSAAKTKALDAVEILKVETKLFNFKVSSSKDTGTTVF